ncbi:MULTISPECIES: hypothetical protein [Synechococcaceae]|uniref:hypothetical protein n=1 Tax=Synechococcaceae TaxID=1890426 RepID=UPI00223B645F|nr:MULTISPECIES: hypothetical protein [Synechococcaceae]MCT0202756.1 hypothetical protein [Synechococcus sp. CS-603]MCT4363682.1 hypothetical protein [Candidatus Regnicoccus frigidus MAG-AL1]MCT4366850.1 hypothetical protein [Candidatus Regnicoccus frigidus MAG-AL2]
MNSSTLRALLAGAALSAASTVLSLPAHAIEPACEAVMQFTPATEPIFQPAPVLEPIRGLW